MKLFGQSSKLGSIATLLGHNANAANAHNAVVFERWPKTRTVGYSPHRGLMLVLRRARREPIVALVMRHQVPTINYWRQYACAGDSAAGRCTMDAGNRSKIADLRDLGFADPVKMITSFPEIAGLTSDNVRRKIADLRDLGFADPVKMITYFPQILGLGIDNIRGRIADLRELGSPTR